MEGRPVRLATFLGAARIAHETIFELHRRVISALPTEHRARELVAESAEIVLSELPSVSASALRLEALWSEKSLLDPGEADRVLDELASELERIEPRLEQLLDRQREIASELRSLLRETGR